MMGTGLTEMATVSAMGKSLCFKAAVMSSGPSNVLAVIKTTQGRNYVRLLHENNNMFDG